MTKSGKMFMKKLLKMEKILSWKSGKFEMWKNEYKLNFRK